MTFMQTLAKIYDFITTEKKIYDMWESRGYFQPWNDPNKPDFNPSIKPYVISIPPPNITGELHLGHAMFVSVEDLMIRYHRMKGEPTLWVPGSDHAGIATQLQIEKILKQEGLSREEIGRDEFIRRAWAWKDKYGGIIIDQIRRLGASCDWSRLRFTLDDGLSTAVREAFVRLYDKGLIYRGPRLINWSPGLRTAVSDLEVEYFDEPGLMYYFKYKFVDEVGICNEGIDHIPVATTRPETILGDTALAVHPNDERFKQFIGRMVQVPILGRHIPIIADEYVDREFGTGALKITPGHDPNDYEIGLKHNLEMICVLDESAKINENGGPYIGLDRFIARDKLWKDMQAAGLTIKEEAYTISIPRSQRGGEIIEPMISTQWFVNIKTLAESALQAVKDKHIEIIPERFEKIYFNWLENIQDWCISRQLWWGHRIPVWYCSDCGEMTVDRMDPMFCAHCQSKNIHQDPDVLDTWFSSGLWPFSTLGWPEKTKDYLYFYPTTMMETGYDILFFWVARMIMSGLEFTGNIPFEKVYLHGLIRDEQGRKMSKTTGNVIDPLNVIDQFGTDALRFTLLVGSTPGNDLNLSMKKVEANRNFANKIWNAGRFIINVINQSPKVEEREPQWTLADSWIWARTQQVIRNVNKLFTNYQFGEAGRQIYEFFWGEFADWYVEIAKLQLNESQQRSFYTIQTLVKVYDLCLRMLHPFTPFITEELWGTLKQCIQDNQLEIKGVNQWPEALIIAPWPEPRNPESWEIEKVQQFDMIVDLIRSIRNCRAERGMPYGRKIPAIIVSSSQSELIHSQLPLICLLAQLEPKKVEVQKMFDDNTKKYIPLVVGEVEIYLPLEGLVNVPNELNRLNKELSEVEEQIIRLEKLLTSAFIKKAPEHIIKKEKQKLAGYKKTAKKLQSQINAIS